MNLWTGVRMGGGRGWMGVVRRHSAVLLGEVEHGGGGLCWAFVVGWGRRGWLK